MKAGELLAKAAEIVGGQRAIDYGDKYTNHKRIAQLWNMWMAETQDKDDTYLEAYDVAMMMLLVKIARLMHSPGHPDSHLDIAGYAAVMEEIWHDQQAYHDEVDAAISAAVAQARNLSVVPPEDVR